MFYANNFNKEGNHDNILHKIVNSIKVKLNERDDDALIVICGTTGTGKSNLMLYIEDEYLLEKSSIDYVGLTRNDLADIQYKIQFEEKPRLLAYDEANVSKRDSLSKWNKDLIDLYLANRGKNIFHIWCNPTIDYLDKLFINERVTGVIFVATKTVDKPRLYYYFTKERLLEIFEKYENLKLKTLYNNRYRALYCGWFKKYKGALLDDYLIKKKERMEDKSKEFYEKYGSKITRKDLLSIQKVADKTLISVNILRKNVNNLIKRGVLVKDRDYFDLPNGSKAYSKDSIELFRENVFNKNKKGGKVV